MLVVTNTQNKHLLKLQRDNMQIIFKLQHDFDVEEIALHETEIMEKTNQEIK
jgi:hypothetical protein